MTDRKVLVRHKINNFQDIPNTDIAEVGNGVTSSNGGSLNLYGNNVISNTSIFPNDDKIHDFGDVGYLWKTIYSDKIKANEMSFYNDTLIISRVCPMEWRGTVVGGSESWIPAQDYGTPQQNSTDVDAKLFFKLQFIHGAKINSVEFRFITAGSGLDPLPQTVPTFNVIRQDLTNSTVGIAVGTIVNDFNYRGNFHIISVNCSDEVVDNENYRYFGLITPESGSDSQIGGTLAAVKRFYTLPANTKIGLE